MKKISEMTEDELRDYALTFEEERKGFAEKEKAYQDQVNELTGLNKALQKRNNDLFLKVEQQGTGAGEENPPEPKKEEKTETCEDFAKRLINGGK